MNELHRVSRTQLSPFVISLSDFKFVPMEKEADDEVCLDFSISHDDVCEIVTPDADKGWMVLNALAGRIKPVSGNCIFGNQTCRTGNYHDMLRYKRQIGYVARDAALISNLTVRENLLLLRYFHENALNITLDSQTIDWCRTWGILEKLGKKPADLNAMDLRATLILREISKNPVLFLFERPEDDIPRDRFDILLSVFDHLIANQVPIVFLSSGQHGLRRFVTHQIQFCHGVFEKVPYINNTGSNGA